VADRLNVALALNPRCAPGAIGGAERSVIGIRKGGEKSYPIGDSNPEVGMGIQDIAFRGLIQNRKFSEITGPEFFNALIACGWKEGTGTHFFQQVRKDGPSRGIHTPADLERAIAAGTSELGRDGKSIHRICNRSAYIVYNAATQTLITFSQGDPLAR
jgi:hypothetical protein